MGDRRRDASALLGMEGFVVLSQSEEDGELYVLVETTATVAGCPSCGVKANEEEALSLGGAGVARVDPRTPVKPGTRFRFSVDVERMHFFDPMSGEVIERGSPLTGASSPGGGSGPRSSEGSGWALPPVGLNARRDRRETDEFPRAAPEISHRSAANGRREGADSTSWPKARLPGIGEEVVSTDGRVRIAKDGWRQRAPLGSAAGCRAERKWVVWYRWRGDIARNSERPPRRHHRHHRHRPAR